MTLGQRLYQLRKDKNLSQEELADRLGVSRQSVSKWETDASYPEPEKLVAIAAFYHVSVDFLLRGEDAEPDREPRHGYPFFRRRFHYEYKSKRTFLGLPLVHVNVGPGLCRAKGVIAVGNVATGLISVGFVAAGLLSFGVLAVGILALACLSFGIFALGAIAAGGVAVGAVAVGLFAVGGVAVGLFSIGGCAIAQYIAYGGYAQGMFAIGDVTAGQYFWHVDEWPDFIALRGEIYETIVRVMPDIQRFILHIFSLT